MQSMCCCLSPKSNFPIIYILTLKVSEHAIKNINYCKLVIYFIPLLKFYHTHYLYFHKHNLSMQLRKTVLTTLLLGATFASFAQKGTIKIDLKGGFVLPEQEKLDIDATGYVIGLNTKFYLNNRIYTLLKVSGDRLDREKKVEKLFYSPENWPKDANYKVKGKDIAIGAGLGYDFFKRGNHILYVQGAFGIGTSYKEERVYKNINGNPNHQSVYHSDAYTSTDWALMGDLGYIYSINKLIGIGASYSADYICWGFTQSFNANLQFTF